jgi:RNA methyltransferase, TrmH family
MKFEDLKKLHYRKHREEFGFFLVEGEHLILELKKAAERDARLRDAEIYCTQNYAHWSTPFVTHVINTRQMTQMSETRSPQGIVAVVPLLTSPAAEPNERAIYLHEIQDPGNLGTILRTLAWFGGFRCLLGPGSVDVHNSKALRASMGAIFHVPVEADVQIESLATRFARIASLDLHGQSIASPSFRDFDCYLFGNEARGLPQEQLGALKSEPFTIIGTRAIESLNVAATVNMCQYELHRPL